MNSKNEHLPEKFGFRNGAEQFPSMILVAISSPCNARCPNCPASKSKIIRRTAEPYLRFKYFQKITDECSIFNSDIRISGYGEPLLNPDLKRSIEYATFKKVRVSLITNGSLLDAEMAEFLLNAEIDAIEISVDSHNEKIYRTLRIGLDFQTVKNNIINLVEMRNKLNKKTVILTSIVNNPARNPDIKGAEKYWCQIADKVLIRTYQTWGVLPENGRGEPYLNPNDRSPCPYPFERLMIDPGGYIRLCPYDDQQLIKPFGHLSGYSIRDVWLGERFNKIRKLHSKKKFDKIELCNQCADYAYRSWTHNYWKGLKEARIKRKAI